MFTSKSVPKTAPRPSPPLRLVVTVTGRFVVAFNPFPGVQHITVQLPVAHQSVVPVGPALPAEQCAWDEYVFHGVVFGLMTPVGCRHRCHATILSILASTSLPAPGSRSETARSCFRPRALHSAIRCTPLFPSCYYHGGRDRATGTAGPRSCVCRLSRAAGLAGLAMGFVPGLPRVGVDGRTSSSSSSCPHCCSRRRGPSRSGDAEVVAHHQPGFALLVVFFTALSVAVVTDRYPPPGFTLALGFLLGGIVSPPDAVSTGAITRFVRIPKATTAILEGESLLNDASSLINLPLRPHHRRHRRRRMAARGRGLPGWSPRAWASDFCSAGSSCKRTSGFHRCLRHRAHHHRTLLHVLGSGTSARFRCAGGGERWTVHGRPPGCSS